MADSLHDHAAQTEELEALQAIYGDAVVVVPLEDASNARCVRVSVTSERSPLHGTLKVTLPLDYPSRGCPVFEVNCPCLSADEVQQVTCTLAAMFCPGEVVVFQCVEWLRGHLQERQLQQGSSEEVEKEKEHSAGCKEAADIVGTTDSRQEQVDTTEQTRLRMDQDSLCAAEDAPCIHHGNPLTDRKSTFQAHVAQVRSKEEVTEVLFRLKQNRKVAMATHNIMAYRIFNEDRNVFIHDCDNDGETAAGSQLLRMLELMDVRNAVVVVSRWYGGVHLGPDRFKHINNCARTVIQDTRIGLTHHLDSTSDKDKHKRKKR